MTGFVFLKKDGGMTSFFAAARLRRIFGEKKTGHTGTLDPMATGVLPVALGGATRFIELLPDHDKSYKAQFQLGTTTDTLDITGTVLTKSDFCVSADEVKQTLEKFLGKQSQIPPMYSAVKKDGVRLYDLARQGVEVERQSREIEIYSLSLEEYDEKSGTYEVDVSCSKGTYIRTLVSDIGERLGCGAVLTKLERTKANGITIDRCLSLDELESLKQCEKLSQALVSVDEVLNFPHITVSEAQAKRFSNGGELFCQRIKTKITHGNYCVYSPEGKFLGVGSCSEDEQLLYARRIYNER